MLQIHIPYLMLGDIRNTTTLFMVFSATCVIVPLTLFLRRMLGYTNDQRFAISVTSWHLAFNYAYQYLGMSMLISVMRCMPMSHNGLQVD